MSDRKWEIGKKYRLVDVAGFNNNCTVNRNVSALLSDKEFTVDYVNQYDKVTKIIEMELPTNFFHWFDRDEIKYFEEVTAPKVEDTSAIVEWLDKLAYVMANEPNVNSIYAENQTTMTIFTELGDIAGNQNVVEFINNRYSQLSEQANKAKREQLLKDIVSAKEAYEAKVRELELLEGK